MALLQKLSLTDLNNGDSVRLLLEQLIKQIDSQQNEIIELRGENDRLLYDNHELEKRVTKVERYSSFMCLTFHGVSDGGEYPVHSIVKILRSVNISIQPQDIVACHYLPGKGRNRPIIVKFLYNHQRDAVWNKRFDFWDDLTGNKIHVNERLAEKDREIMNYCRRDKNLLASTHKNQVQIKKYNSYGRWQPIDNKKDVDIYMGNDISVTTDNEKYTDVIQNAADSDDVQYPKSYSFLGTPGKRKRNVAFRSPDSHESQNDIQERKLDKLCCLVEKLIESHSPPPKKMTTSGDVVSDDNMGSSEEKDQPEN